MGQITYKGPALPAQASKANILLTSTVIQASQAHLVLPLRLLPFRLLLVRAVTECRSCHSYLGCSGGEAPGGTSRTTLPRSTTNTASSSSSSSPSTWPMP